MLKKWSNIQLLLFIVACSGLQAADSLEKRNQQKTVVQKASALPSTLVAKSENNMQLPDDRLFSDVLGVGIIMVSMSMFYKLSTGQWEL